MAMYDDFMDDMLAGEAPCEFCGELYPFVLLIEHQTACDPEMARFRFDDNTAFLEQPVPPKNPNEVIDTILAPEIKQLKAQISVPKEPVIATEVKQTQSPKRENKTEPSVVTEVKQAQSAKRDIKTELASSKRIQTRREDFSEESGEKLMVYGTDTDPDKSFESESQVHKMPNNPLLQDVNEKEDIEDIDNLSDDDCKESLEEFWKRARDFLKRRRIKNS